MFSVGREGASLGVAEQGGRGDEVSMVRDSMESGRQL